MLSIGGIAVVEGMGTSAAGQLELQSCLTGEAKAKGAFRDGAWHYLGSGCKTTSRSLNRIDAGESAI